VYGQYDCHYVLNSKALIPEDMRGKTSFITHSERDWKFFMNLWEAYKILRQERPQVILSTGAGLAVPFALVGRGLFGSKVIFIETMTRIYKPSLTGRIMYWIAHDFFYQWKPLETFFPKGRYGGPLI